VKGGQRVEGPESFQEVVNNWLERYVEAKGLLSGRAIRANLQNHVLPACAGREFESIRRGDVAALLDTVEDNSGQVAADRVLAVISTICKWYAGRHENYQIPLVPGMRRADARARARDRVLGDDEIRLIWSKAEGTFGDLVRLLLLTAQRRDKVASVGSNLGGRCLDRP
jgi:hypothetical protein